MKENKKSKFPTKYLLLVMVILCILLIVGSVGMSGSVQPLKKAAETVFVPMQKGINSAGTWLTEHTQTLKSKTKVMEENENLKLQIADLESELSRVQLDQYELDQLRGIYELDQSFPEYEKVAASVIGKDTGNWFSTFLINKGSEDGIQEGNNVMAGSGLIGIVTEVGPSYATVRAIIDDNNSVSAMVLPDSNYCIVNGNLIDMNESQYVEFTNLQDKDNVVNVGDQVVTSYISDRYLPGLPIGYIVDMETDSNQLTKSGHIAPLADFEHIETVLVILELKEGGQADTEKNQ